MSNREVKFGEELRLCSKGDRMLRSLDAKKNAIEMVLNFPIQIFHYNILKYKRELFPKS